MADISRGTSPLDSATSCTSVRRRKLFPLEDDKSSDDLGSPLNDDIYLNDSDNEEGSVKEKFGSSSFSDYEVLESLVSSRSFEIVYQNEKTEGDSLNESDGLIKIFDDSVTSNETPSRLVPIVSMKTPEDAASTSLNTSYSELEPTKRKVSPLVSNSPSQEHSSKVRTVLFPQSDITIPASTFYSNSENHRIPLALQIKASDVRKHKQKSPTIYLCSRKRKGKKSFGEINAGVRHSFKRPKPKKVVVHNIMEGCTAPLLEYLNDLKDLSCNTKQIQEVKKMTESSCDSVLVESQRMNIVQSKSCDMELQSRKRKGSPLVDSNKKFFKHRRHNATFTVDERVKFVVDEGKLTLLDNKVVNCKAFNQYDNTDLEMFDNENLISRDAVDSIIFNLGKEEEDDFVLKPYCALPKRENSVDLNNVCKPIGKENKMVADDNSILLSPTTQMCNMTSGLALNSPTKAVCNLNSILNKENVDTNKVDKEKLFPVFYGPHNPPPKPAKLNKSGSLKKIRPLSKDQMLLDAGQKKFGAGQCTECKFVYHMGDMNDELMHQNYHSAASVLRFSGWKDEQVMGQLGNGRIIRILPHHPKSWLKKVNELLEVVNRDLGYYDMETILDNTQVYLYISQKTIIGCLVAEPKSVGYPMLSENTGIDLCSEIGYPIKCGVSRVWVAQAHRQSGIGRALLNCLRANFLFGGVLNENDIAFTSPTVAGKAFARKYFNTPNFLVYFS